MGGILFLLLVPSIGALGQNKSPMTEPIAGKLISVVAIGGETTGWALILDSERQIDDTRIKQIDVDPRPQKIRLDPFRDKRVEVTGTLTWRQGVERGRYPVIVIETIREQSP